MAEDKKSSETGRPEEDEAGMGEDEIDLNLIETFPASDPPSWTLGTDHHNESKRKQGGDKSEAED